MQPATSTDTDQFWKVFPAYEAGKSRRYGHLFAVNGGAFALVAFLGGRYAGGSAALPGDLPLAGALPGLLFQLWAFVLLPVLLGLFDWKMCADIDSFGRGMRKLAGYPENERLHEGIYRQEGRDLLASVRAIFTIGWAVAAAIGVLDACGRIARLFF